LQWAAAAKFYTEAIAAAPSHYFQADGQAAAVLSNRSFAYLKLGLFEKSLNDAVECAKLRPDWSKSHFRKAEVYRHLGRWSDAASAYDKASKCDPNDAVLLQYLQNARERASLAATPEEWIHETEQRLGLTADTVWSFRCGLAGFVLCCCLLYAQPSDINNVAANAMLPISGILLGAGAGLAIRMIRAAKRRERLAPPDLPAAASAARAGGSAAAAASGRAESCGGGGGGGGDGDDYDGEGPAADGGRQGKRTSRIKGLSRSLRNRAGQS
jgi:tetratricopeptide (TPR) repeat protein